MVSIGKPSSSTPGSGKKTSTKELVTVFGGTMVGVAVLLLGVVGIIVSLPEPKSTVNLGPHKMLTPEQAAKAAHERLEKAKKEALQKNKYHTKFAKQMPTMISSDQASKDARARLARAGAEYVKFKDLVCEDERSFLIELLTDSQLYEFMEYLERDEDEDGEYYRAETLKKDSCCCGATVEDPCACMIEGVMDCSAVEPKCPCYAAEENCQACGTKLCDSCGFCDICEGGDINPCCARRTYGMRKGWGAESFAAENTVSEVTVYVEVPDKANTESVSFQLPQHIIENEDVIHEAIENRLMDILQQPFGGWDLISVKKLEAESVVKEYNPDEMIPIGTKVRSYDFWPHDKTCYKEGVIVDHAPSPSCSPGCMHYHIRTTKVVRRGKSRPVEEGEIFMTHPYADPWDQEYPGQLAQHIKSVSTAFPSTASQ